MGHLFEEARAQLGQPEFETGTEGAARLKKLIEENRFSVTQLTDLVPIMSEGTPLEWALAWLNR